MSGMLCVLICRRCSAVQLFNVLAQAAEEGVSAECRRVADEDELHSGTGDGHVHAAEVT